MAISDLVVRYIIVRILTVATLYSSLSPIQFLGQKKAGTWFQQLEPAAELCPNDLNKAKDLDFRS